MAAKWKRHYVTNGVQNLGNYLVDRIQIIRGDVVPNLIQVATCVRIEKRIRSRTRFQIGHGAFASKVGFNIVTGDRLYLAGLQVVIIYLRIRVTAGRLSSKARLES